MTIAERLDAAFPAVCGTCGAHIKRADQSWRRCQACGVDQISAEGLSNAWLTQRLSSAGAANLGSPAMIQYRCPTAAHAADLSPHTVIGCGSWNTTERDDEGLVDCLDCGIWFNPDSEATESRVISQPRESDQ